MGHSATSDTVWCARCSNLSATAYVKLYAEASRLGVASGALNKVAQPKAKVTENPGRYHCTIGQNHAITAALNHVQNLWIPETRLCSVNGSRCSSSF